MFVIIRLVRLELVTCGSKPGGKRGLNSSRLVDIGLGSSMIMGRGIGLFSVGTNLGSKGIREGLPTCMGEIASCCLLGPTGVPSF